MKQWGNIKLGETVLSEKDNRTDLIKNRNYKLEKEFENEVGMRTVEFDGEYDFDFYMTEYTQWLEIKLEECRTNIAGNSKI